MTAARKKLSASTRQAITIVALFVLPAMVVAGFLYELHSPTPRHRTSVVITRSSLLPHRFAGPCLNCHHIQEGPPVALSAANMNMFNLSPQQRTLLSAGQRVAPPTLAEHARAPAILRDDTLPHPFVGVCSNCHPVLAFRPSRSFFRDSMRRAYQPLSTRQFSRERIARGGTREHHKSELLRNVWGYLALGLLGLSCVYVGMRMLLRSYPQEFKGKFKLKPWFSVHEWASSGFCLAAIMHWYYSDRGNNFLHLALIGVIWLTGAGYALRYRMAKEGTRKNVKLVHTQRFVFLSLLVLLIVGHLFAEFH